MHFHMRTTDICSPSAAVAVPSGSGLYTFSSRLRGALRSQVQEEAGRIVVIDEFQGRPHTRMTKIHVQAYEGFVRPLSQAAARPGRIVTSNNSGAKIPHCMRVDDYSRGSHPVHVEPRRVCCLLQNRSIPRAADPELESAGDDVYLLESRSITSRGEEGARGMP